MASDGKSGKLLQKRLIRFGGRTTRVAQSLPKTEERRYIAQQLLRSGLAAAPNYAEARAAESRADFIHKLRVVLKELNETESWLEQIVENGLYSATKWVRLSRKTRNCASSSRLQSGPLAPHSVQLEVSNLGSPMRDSSDFKI